MKNPIREIVVQTNSETQTLPLGGLAENVLFNTNETLEDRMTDINSNIAALENEDSVLQEEIDDCVTVDNSIKTAIAGLQDKDTEIKNNISTLQTNANSADSKLQSNLDTASKDADTNYNSAIAKYNDLLTDYETLNNKLDKLLDDFTIETATVTGSSLSITDCADMIISDITISGSGSGITKSVNVTITDSTDNSKKVSYDIPIQNTLLATESINKTDGSWVQGSLPCTTDQIALLNELSKSWLYKNGTTITTTGTITIEYYKECLLIDLFGPIVEKILA